MFTAQDTMSGSGLEDGDFLTWVLDSAKRGNRVNQIAVTRLRKLADYADAPFPAMPDGALWIGVLDYNEVRGAVSAARERIAAGLHTTRGMLVPK